MPKIPGAAAAIVSADNSADFGTFVEGAVSRLGSPWRGRLNDPRAGVDVRHPATRAEFTGQDHGTAVRRGHQHRTRNDSGVACLQPVQGLDDVPAPLRAERDLPVLQHRDVGVHDATIDARSPTQTRSSVRWQTCTYKNETAPGRPPLRGHACKWGDGNTIRSFAPNAFLSAGFLR
jgi:hypothetical protein